MSRRESVCSVCFVCRSSVLMSPFSDGVSARPRRSADGLLTRFHRKHGSYGSSRSIASSSDYPLRNISCTPSLLLQVLLAVAADKLAAHVVPLLSRSCGRLAPLSSQLSGPRRSRRRDGPSQFSAPLYRTHALVFTASLRSATRNTVRSNAHNLLILRVQHQPSQSGGGSAVNRSAL